MWWQVVVIMRTALQDRIAALNGRSVQHVLRQVRHPLSLLVLACSRRRLYRCCCLLHMVYVL